MRKSLCLLILFGSLLGISACEAGTGNHVESPTDTPIVEMPRGEAPVPSATPEPSSGLPDGFETHTYEVTARLHDNMPEYRFVATGAVGSEEKRSTGFVLGLKGYDENGKQMLSKDFSQVWDGELVGYHVYNEMMDTMGLHVVDVNFDGYRDIIILNTFSGAHGNTWYDCWLWDPETSSFVFSESFAGICNPALDPEKQCIYSAGGSGAAYWGGFIYQFIDGAFVVTNELYTDWDGLEESALVHGQMETVRKVSYGDGVQSEILEKEQEYYKNSELWQLDHPHWYWVGGHHADQWLESWQF